MNSIENSLVENNWPQTNVFITVRHWLIDAVNRIISQIKDHNQYNEEQLKAIINKFTVEVPKDPSHGEISTNIAMLLASYLKLPAVEVAKKIVAALTYQDGLNQNEQNLPSETLVQIKGAFINLILPDKFWQNLLEQINLIGDEYGKNNLWLQEKINLEFVSANPTGPMHIGHARSAVVGDVLANLLEYCNFDVTKEYYINDAGGQVDVLTESLWIRYLQILGHDAELKDGCYPGEYLIETAKELYAKFGDPLLNFPEEKRNAEIKEFAIQAMLNLIKKDLNTLGVFHDVFVSEDKDIRESGEVNKTIELLQSKNLLYYGTLENPKGHEDQDWEPRNQLLFRSTEFGDDRDRALLKSNGSYTYFAPDIAYHYHKFKRGFSNMILLLGADHIGYVSRLKAAVSSISDGQAQLKVVINQLVNVMQNGQAIKMSKRSGNFITLNEVLHELGSDILRFVMLWRNSDTVLDLDLAKAKEQSNDNPVFYVQYAHARAVSVLQKAAEKFADVDLSIQEQNGKIVYNYCCYNNRHDSINYNNQNITGSTRGKEIIKKTIDYSKITTIHEKKLIQDIALFPQIIILAATKSEPHRLTHYLYQLAASFHGLWNRGTENEAERFILDDNDTTKARLALVYCAAHTIGIGLKLLGIKPMLSI